jgi:hypothetical protein
MQVARENHLICEWLVIGILPRNPGERPVIVTLSIGDEGILKIEVEIDGSRMPC